LLWETHQRVRTFREADGNLSDGEVTGAVTSGVLTEDSFGARFPSDEGYGNAGNASNG